MNKDDLSNKLTDEKRAVYKLTLETIQKIFEDCNDTRQEKFLKKYFSQKTIIKAISKSLNIPFVDLSDLSVRATNKLFEIMDMIPKDIMEKHNIIPIEKVENTLKLAMSDPLDIIALDKIKKLTRCKIQPMIAEEDEIKKLIKKFKYADEYKSDMDKKESLSEKVKYQNPKHNFLYRETKFIANIIKASFIAVFKHKDIYIDNETGDIIEGYNENKQNYD
jgi:hypothetical protein